MASGQLIGGKFRIERQIVRGDRSGRSPSLYEVSDAGAFLFARSWVADGNSADLKALWNHEVRSLLRLGGYPRSGDYFVRLRDLGYEDKRFYVVLDAGERQPLAPMLADRGRRPWLRDVSTPARRRRIWEGLRRIATGISILHGEGTIHRAISPASVFSDNRGDCDFRLSGFEWSLRVAAPVPVSKGATSAAQGVRLRAPELEKVDARYSFATDWFDFGVLCTEIFGFEPVGRGAKTVERLREVVLGLAYLGPPEKALILGLVEADPERRFSSSTMILQGLSEAHTSVRSRTISVGNPLYVGFALGLGSRISEAIVDITKGSRDTVRIDDVDGQLRFIQKDIAGETQIIISQLPNPHFVINGRILQYRVQRWERGVETWDVGFSQSVDPPPSDPSDRVASLDGRKIEVRAAPALSRNIVKARSLGAAWDAVFPFESMKTELDDDQRLVLDFFRITNQLDALLAAAQIWPVTVVTVDEQHEGAEIEVTPLPDSERNNLARNVNLGPTDEQMRTFFAGDAISSILAEEATYTLSQEGVLGRGEEATSIRWRYNGTIRHPQGIRYRLIHNDVGLPVPLPGSNMFLMPAGLAGTIAQLKRRQRAIEAMSSHGTLLSAIADPDKERRDTSDTPGKGPTVAGMDQSKQLALNGIWQTQPLYVLQGPPGTGKTRLLETMAVRLLEIDASVQTLITAHSHEAVRHVQKKLAERTSALPPVARPVVVRLDDKDDADHVRPVSGRLAAAIARSELAKSVPDHIRERAILIAADIEQNKPPSRDVRSLEALVKRSANVIFATSNSGELAQMLEDNARFDWSIIEEAGKAHGFDLALALQASHRVLMIGDQEQLPPFNFSALEALFREPPRILNAMASGAGFAPGLVGREFIGLSAGSQQKFAENCTVWLTMVQFFAEMFRRCESSVVADVPIAMRLGLQHRMHPTISDLISKCFYRGQLKTHDEAIRRFDTTPPPYDFVDGSWMPDQRVVFVDLDWIQDRRNAAGEEGGDDGKRRYTNPGEIEAAGRVLSQFVARPETDCELQVLSPYRAQVRALGKAFSEKIAGEKLTNLAAPEFMPLNSKRLGATVDEFQGSEADVIIVSLVRNNDEAIGKGLGFLADRRRFNVLLSRARHKLVLVGSWNFLTSRIDCSKEPDEENNLAHIARIMRWLDEERIAGRVKRVPFADTFWGASS